jgi:hypothetical protein
MYVMPTPLSVIKSYYKDFFHVLSVHNSFVAMLTTL